MIRRIWERSPGATLYALEAWHAIGSAPEDGGSYRWRQADSASAMRIGKAYGLPGNWLVDMLANNS